MSVSVINLNDRKQLILCKKKIAKYRRIIEDLSVMLNILHLARKGLSFFKLYKTSENVILMIENEGYILELTIKKYNRLLEEEVANARKLEKS